MIKSFHLIFRQILLLIFKYKIEMMLKVYFVKLQDKELDWSNIKENHNDINLIMMSVIVHRSVLIMSVNNVYRKIDINHLILQQFLSEVTNLFSLKKV